MAAQCGILFIGIGGQDDPRLAALRSLGFKVDESTELPPTDELTSYHAIMVRAASQAQLPMIGARLRGKPRFGRRVLIALVKDDVSERGKRDATMCGFDEVLPGACGARDIAAHILRLLRGYPEYRCLLRSPLGPRRKAA